MKYLRRAAAFLAKKAVLYTLILSLLTYTFYMAFNLSNAYIVVSEGLEERVRVTLTRTGSTALKNYFSDEFVNVDIRLSKSRNGTDEYRFFDISSFEYDVKVSNLRWHPLRTHNVIDADGKIVQTYHGVITCTITETVSNISGSLKREYATDENKHEIEHWNSGRYDVTLGKVNGSWRVVSMVQDLNFRDPES